MHIYNNTDKELRKTQGLKTWGVMKIQIRQQVNEISYYGNKLMAEQRKQHRNQNQNTMNIT